MRAIIDSETFVSIWQKCRSLDEVAQKTGMRKTTASQRAWYLRGKGVPLKPFQKCQSYTKLSDLARDTREE